MKRVLSLIAASMVVGGSCTNRKITETDALVIIDVQNCFMEGPPKGSLGVAGAEKEFVTKLQNLITKFEAANGKIVVSLDWHPKNHCSFREGTEGDPAYCATGADKLMDGCRPTNLCEDPTTKENIQKEKDGHTMLWPEHCRGDIDEAERDAGSSAQLWKGLNFTKSVTVIKKGYVPTEDAYSAAQGIIDEEAGKIMDGEVDLKWENNPEKMVELAADKAKKAVTLEMWAKEKGITTMFQTGIATDYCVMSTAKDVSEFEKIDQIMMADAMVGVDVQGSLKAAVDTITKLGEWAKNDAKGLCVGVDKEAALKMQLDFKKKKAPSVWDKLGQLKKSAMEKLGQWGKSAMAKLGKLGKKATKSGKEND